LNIICNCGLNQCLKPILHCFSIYEESSMIHSHCKKLQILLSKSLLGVLKNYLYKQIIFISMIIKLNCYITIILIISYSGNDNVMVMEWHANVSHNRTCKKQRKIDTRMTKAPQRSRFTFIIHTNIQIYIDLIRLL